MHGRREGEGGVGKSEMGPVMSDSNRGANPAESNDLAKEHGRIGALALLFDDVSQPVAVGRPELVGRLALPRDCLSQPRSRLLGHVAASTIVAHSL